MKTTIVYQRHEFRGIVWYTPYKVTRGDAEILIKRYPGEYFVEEKKTIKDQSTTKE